ncbi:MAG TPA: SDR family oxidoreductase [Acidimicrobiia bacterium]|nr:SDR family oxidoreductase [Acidimicrobiia bacterium]
MSALSGRVAVVTGADQALGHGLALAIGTSGARVALVGDATTLTPVADTIRDRGGHAAAFDAVLTERADLERAFAAAADTFGDPVTALVHTAMNRAAFEQLDFADVDDARWELIWEGTMRAALALLQASYTPLHGRDGRIVFVAPTVSMSGAERLVPYTTALEGQRLLAKSAARQWGPDGITVNTVAVAPEQVPIGVASAATSLAPPALGGPGQPEADVGPVVTFLLGAAGRFVTGSTLSIDGGVWMAP